MLYKYLYFLLYRVNEKLMNSKTREEDPSLPWFSAVAFVTVLAISFMVIVVKLLCIALDFQLDEGMMNSFKYLNVGTGAVLFITNWLIVRQVKTDKVLLNQFLEKGVDVLNRHTLRLVVFYFLILCIAMFLPINQS